MTDASPAGEWCLIESDPGVFTELLTGFGVTGLQVEELWSLEPEQFSTLHPVHGLIFLFKWKADLVDSTTTATPNIPDDELEAAKERVYFARQVINNACGTQALVNILFNIDTTKFSGDNTISLGCTLQDFYSFSASFDPLMRGLTLSNSDTLRTVHNSFARGGGSIFEFSEQYRKASEKDDVYHFIAYLPVNDIVFELDGLKEGPIALGKIPSSDDSGSPNDNWLSVVRPVIENRIARYSSDEIRFNLMAVVSDQRAILRDRLSSFDPTMKADIENIKDLISREEEKRVRYQRENIRRRHNYLPFIMEMLKILAKDGRLVELVREHREKVEATEKKKKEKEQENEDEKTAEGVGEKEVKSSGDTTDNGKKVDKNVTVKKSVTDEPMTEDGDSGGASDRKKMKPDEENNE